MAAVDDALDAVTVPFGDLVGRRQREPRSRAAVTMAPARTCAEL
ncbi:hypothetical protein [Paractinoplanes durhamensis]